MNAHRALVAAIGLSLLLAACGGASTSTARPGASQGEPPLITPTPVPVPSPADDNGSGGGGIGGDPAAGGGTGGDPGSGGDPGGGGLIPIDPIPPHPDPGEPQIVTLNPLATGAHEIAPVALAAAVDGRRVQVLVAWWGGVEPCSVLAGVDVARDGTTFTISIDEGSAAGPGVACIEIAVYKGTVVDLGELEPGMYTVAATGGAVDPIEVVVE